MRDFQNSCSVLTKSPLLLRDIALFKQIAARTEFVANLSVPTLDEKAWRATEPHTPHPRTRLAAVGELNRAGIPTGVLVAPLDWLRQYRPDLVTRYETLYGRGSGAYLPKDERARLAKLARGKNPPRRFLRERPEANEDPEVPTIAASQSQLF